MWAASNNHAEVVKLLLAAGADVHVRNKVGPVLFMRQINLRLTHFASAQDGKTALTMAATEEIGDLLHGTICDCFFAQCFHH
jgi:ankyrin repeat protein